MIDKSASKEFLEEAQFSMQKVYVKDISFETPNSPLIFKDEWKPYVDMHITNEAKKIEDHLFDVVLSVTVTVKVGKKVAYLAEINQAGIYLLKNIPDELIDRVLATACPNILFPFAREALSNLVTRGGFPQLLLAPVNFDALYEQQIQNRNAQQTSTKH